MSTVTRALRQAPVLSVALVLLAAALAPAHADDHMEMSANVCGFNMPSTMCEEGYVPGQNSTGCYHPDSEIATNMTDAKLAVRCYSPSTMTGISPKNSSGACQELDFESAKEFCESYEDANGVSDFHLPTSVAEAGAACGTGCTYDDKFVWVMIADSDPDSDSDSDSDSDAETPAPAPAPEATEVPTASPTPGPTDAPTVAPTAAPTAAPTVPGTTISPTTDAPTVAPTVAPTSNTTNQTTTPSTPTPESAATRPELSMFLWASAAVVVLGYML